MCIALPARIVSIDGTPGDPFSTAVLDVAGREESCRLAYLPDARVGDHVLVQHGFGVELLDAEAAAQSLAAFEELGLLDAGPAD